LRYASSDHILADFGLAPRKARRELTAVEKLERVARAKATRDARHTVGPRQKAKIHGQTDVTVVVATGSSANTGGGTSASSGGAPTPSPAPVPPAPAPAPPPPMLPAVLPSTNGAAPAYGMNGAANGAALGAQ
jgi:hypothetical protein